jgi:AraC-like DNA-binding protein
MVRVGAAVHLPALLRERKVDANAMIRTAGLDPCLLLDAANVIPFGAMGHLLGSCAAQAACPHLGLLLGQRGNGSSLGIVGLLLREARTVGSALRDLVKYLHLHDRGAVWGLAVHDDVAVLSYSIYEAGVESTGQLADVAMAVAANQMRILCGAAWNPSEVLLPHSQPPAAEAFGRFFRAPVRFDAEQASLVFRASSLEQLVKGADPDLHRLLKEQLDQLKPAAAADLPDQMRRVLRTLLTSHRCSAESTAHLFAIHRRTLNRRLKAAGTAFHTLVEEIRYEIARQLLAETTMPMVQVTAALHYSEASAFTRAFRRWSGLTPSEWRAQHSLPPTPFIAGVRPSQTSHVATPAP